MRQFISMATPRTDGRLMDRGCGSEDYIGDRIWLGNHDQV